MSQPSTGSSGVPWVVLRAQLVPVLGQDGHPLGAIWNPRARLTTRRDRPIGRVFAPDKSTAQALAQAYYPGVPGPQVQSAVSYAISLNESASARRDRKAPVIASTKRVRKP